MSQAVSVFVKASCSLEQVVSCVENVIGQHLIPTRTDLGVSYLKSIMGLEVSVYFDSDLEDEGDFHYSDYSYVVSFLIYSGPDNENRFKLCQAFSLRVSSLIKIFYNVDCMVVENGTKSLQ